MERKFLAVSIVILVATLFAVYGFISPGQPGPVVPVKEGGGIAVVELFTSEGCSSCPAAEDVIERLSKKNLPNVFVLAYHVDYWNRLGWTDSYSAAANSARQSRYAEVFGLNSVYTPQVVVNGASELVGSDESKLTGSVQKYLNHATAEHLTVETSRDKNNLAVKYKISGPDKVFLNLALVQPEATVAVKKGENGGRTLHHVNIVRMLSTTEANGSGLVTIVIPESLSAIPLELVAFTQDKKNLHIRAADKKAL